MKQILSQEYSPQEIEQELDLPENTVIEDIARNRFWSHEVRKDGSNWLLTKREAIRVYKNEWTNVSIKCDSSIIYNYVFSKLNGDEELYHIASTIYEVVDLKKLTSIVADMYSDGIDGVGLYEEGKIAEYMCLEQYLFAVGYYHFPEVTGKEAISFGLK